MSLAAADRPRRQCQPGIALRAIPDLRSGRAAQGGRAGCPPVAELALSLLTCMLAFRDGGLVLGGSCSGAQRTLVARSSCACPRGREARALRRAAPGAPPEECGRRRSSAGAEAEGRPESVSGLLPEAPGMDGACARRA